jgi:hypothetical protein
MVAVAALAIVGVPMIAATLWDASTATFYRLAVVLLALFPGTVAWIARGARRPGLVLAAALLTPFAVMVWAMSVLGGLVAGALGFVGLGIAITMAVVASRGGGRPALALGYVLGAVGVVLFVVGPVVILSFGLRL